MARTVKNFKNKENNRITKVAVQIIIGIAAIVILLIGAERFEALDRQQNLELTKQAIQKATIQCYANEGRYPDSLEYLEKNYNLYIDYDKFNVLYDALASNIIPNINVYIKK